MEYATYARATYHSLRINMVNNGPAHYVDSLHFNSQLMTTFRAGE